MHFTSSLLMLIITSVHCATIDQFAQLFSDQKVVAAREARADRKANREAAAEAEIIASAKAEKEAAEQEAKEQAEKEAAETAAAILAAKQEQIQTLKDEKKQYYAINEFSNKRESSTYHIYPQKFYIKPTSTNWLCMAVPAAISSGSYDNDQRVILKKCDTTDTSQLFIYDPTSDYIYPEESRTYCLGYNIDDRISGNPLAVFKCDKVWTSTTNSKHKQWTFTNKTHIINSSNKKCIGTGTAGSTPHVGNMIKQYTCADSFKQQNWIWVPQEYYKATELGRNFIV